MKSIKDQSIGLLSYCGSPLTYHAAVRLRELGYTNIFVLCEGDRPVEKFIEIIRERSDGEVKFSFPTDFESLTVPFYFTTSHNSDACFSLLRKLNCQLLANCGTTSKIGKKVLSAVPFGVVNCHPGLLPKYRGCSSVEWTLECGDQVAATAHFMAEEYDSGPIIETFPMDIAGLQYRQIRAKMIMHQSKCVAEAVNIVITSGKKPNEYSPQGVGKSWPIMPADKVAALMGKIF